MPKICYKAFRHYTFPDDKLEHILVLGHSWLNDWINNNTVLRWSTLKHADTTTSSALPLFISHTKATTESNQSITAIESTLLELSLFKIKLARGNRKTKTAATAMAQPAFSNYWLDLRWVLHFHENEQQKGKCEISN